MVYQIQRHRISGTTDGSGAATVYFSGVNGKIKSISLDIDGLDNTADITITSDGELVAQTIYSKTDSNTNAVIYPRTPVQDNAGNDVTYDGTRKIYDDFVVIGRVKVVVAQGGATKAFSASMTIEEY